MGNSSTSESNKSPYEILHDQYSQFNIPAQLENSSLETTTPQGQKVVVYGKKYEKANFFVSKNFLSPIEWEGQVNKYLQRHNGQQLELFPIVKVYGIKQKQLSNVCSSYKSYFVITEELTLLNQIQEVFSCEQCLYTLFEALMGFYYLFVKHGNFKITDKMIGLNSQGKVKLWINQNFAENDIENKGIELYINRNFSVAGQQSDEERQKLAQFQMIKQILSIIGKKQKINEQSFISFIQTNILQRISGTSSHKLTFEKLLRALCEFQEASVNQRFIPNKIILLQEYESKLPERESFSMKLNKAISTYRQQKDRFVQQKQNVYSTGVHGNTLKQYVPEQKQAQTQSCFKKPQVIFHYQDSGYQSGYIFNRYLSELEFSHIHNRDYSIKGAQSEFIGIRQSEFAQRLDQFDPLKQNKSQNTFAYTMGDYQNQIQSMSKDMQDTYFRSTGDSPKYESNYQKEKSFNVIGDPLTSSIQSRTPMPEYFSNIKNKTTPSESSYNLKNGNSNYKQNLIAQYFKLDPNNNFMRITEQLEQESFRPSLTRKTNQQSNSMFKERNILLEDRIVAPIIESRFTEGHNSMRISPDYVQRPFCYSPNRDAKNSLDTYEKDVDQTGQTFY